MLRGGVGDEDKYWGGEDENGAGRGRDSSHLQCRQNVGEVRARAGRGGDGVLRRAGIFHKSPPRKNFENFFAHMLDTWEPLP